MNKYTKDDLKDYGNGVYELLITCQWCKYENVYISVANAASCYCELCSKNSYGEMEADKA